MVTWMSRSVMWKNDVYAIKSVEKHRGQTLNLIKILFVWTLIST